LSKIDSEIEELLQVIATNEKTLARLEKEKKKAAAEKKFKEAAKAQSDIKDATLELEEAKDKNKIAQREREAIEKEFSAKDLEINGYEE
jgi:hypothetical protein